MPFGLLLKGHLGGGSGGWFAKGSTLVCFDVYAVNGSVGPGAPSFYREAGHPFSWKVAAVAAAFPEIVAQAPIGDSPEEVQVDLGAFLKVRRVFLSPGMAAAAASTPTQGAPPHGSLPLLANGVGRGRKTAAAHLSRIVLVASFPQAPQRRRQAAGHVAPGVGERHSLLGPMVVFLGEGVVR